jgi:hypothetical protein
MTRDETLKKGADSARRAIQWWSHRCHQSPAAALLSAAAAGFLAGLVLRAFERRK